MKKSIRPYVYREGLILGKYHGKLPVRFTYPDSMFLYLSQDTFYTLLKDNYFKEFFATHTTCSKSYYNTNFIVAVIKTNLPQDEIDSFIDALHEQHVTFYLECFWDTLVHIYSVYYDKHQTPVRLTNQPLPRNLKLPVEVRDYHKILSKLDNRSNMFKYLDKYSNTFKEKILLTQLESN